MLFRLGAPMECVATNEVGPHTCHLLVERGVVALRRWIAWSVLAEISVGRRKR
jgi:hypothetical protein